MNKWMMFATLGTVLSLSGCAIGPKTQAQHQPQSVSQDKQAQNQPQSMTGEPPIAVNKLLKNPPKHIVVVIEENHSYSEIAGNQNAAYINSLMREGAVLTDYHGVEHPSQPNYLDLFSGSNQGVTTDSCPHTFSTQNLASELLAHALTFNGYAEDLPSVGFTGCSNGKFGLSLGATYARKHSPWVNFTNVPSTNNLPFSLFPKDFNQLPTVSFVIPNLQHDMHDGSIEESDKWLRLEIDTYAKWAIQNDSLLIVTWDEDDQSSSNHVPTFLVGGMVRPGLYDEPANHFNLLRTIEDLYGLPHLGETASVKPFTDIWQGKI